MNTLSFTQNPSLKRQIQFFLCHIKIPKIGTHSMKKPIMEQPFFAKTLIRFQMRRQIRRKIRFFEQETERKRIILAIIGFLRRGLIIELLAMRNSWFFEQLLFSVLNWSMECFGRVTQKRVLISSISKH